MPNDGSSALRITAISPSAGNLTVTWSTVPGKTYKVLYADSPGGPWLEDLALSQLTADVGQTSLSYTDSTVGTAGQRFYRIKLVTP